MVTLTISLSFLSLNICYRENIEVITFLCLEYPCLNFFAIALNEKVSTMESHRNTVPCSK